MINQRDIVLLSLENAKGHEQSGKRPAVVISVDDFHISGCLIVCPITTKIKNYFGDIILKPDKINNLKDKSEILTGQIRTVDLNRVISKIGEITDSELNTLFKGLDVLLGRF